MLNPSASMWLSRKSAASVTTRSRSAKAWTPVLQQPRETCSQHMCPAGPTGFTHRQKGDYPFATPKRENAAMLLNRNEISADKSFNLLTEAILERDQAKTTDTFFKMVQSGQSIGDALSIVTEAEAPYIQVPCHINFRDGNIALTNNDHTLLGLRASTYLMPYLPEKYRLLPLLQSVWYIGAGLDIWNQLLYKYPGRYATMKGVTVPPPPYGPTVWH